MYFKILCASSIQRECSGNKHWPQVERLLRAALQRLAPVLLRQGRRLWWRTALCCTAPGN
jgi:hypothetical protein